MYYPLSQIKTNLYTNGNEFITLNSKQIYIGFYWENSKGQTFTGKTPQDLFIEELLPIDFQSLEIIPNITNTNVIYNNDEIVESYISLVNPNLITFQLPSYSPNIPTDNNYKAGEYRRLFCKKTNEILYIEISPDFYKKLVNKDSTVAYEYYTPFNIPWKLTGDKEQVYKVNKNIVELTIKQQKLPSFNKYLKEDYIKYYK